MSLKTRLMLLSIPVALGSLAAGPAFAQVGLAPPFIEYAAKFSCGLQSADADVVKGTYATSINIHNPQATVEVPFAKKFVLANEEGQPAGAIVVHQDVLGPDIAERVDCDLIAKMLQTGTAHIEGFIVLEVPPMGQFQPVLDVVGKYTARPVTATSTVTSFNITRYDSKSITK